MRLNEIKNISFVEVKRKQLGFFTPDLLFLSYYVVIHNDLNRTAYPLTGSIVSFKLHLMLFYWEKVFTTYFSVKPPPTPNRILLKSHKNTHKKKNHKMNFISYRTRILISNIISRQCFFTHTDGRRCFVASTESIPLPYIALERQPKKMKMCNFPRSVFISSSVTLKYTHTYTQHHQQETVRKFFNAKLERKLQGKFLSTEKVKIQNENIFITWNDRMLRIY